VVRRAVRDVSGSKLGGEITNFPLPTRKWTMPGGFSYAMTVFVQIMAQTVSVGIALKYRPFCIIYFTYWIST
jgi:hypothetical protein